MEAAPQLLFECGAMQLCVLKCLWRAAFGSEDYAEAVASALAVTYAYMHLLLV